MTKKVSLSLKARRRVIPFDPQLQLQVLVLLVLSFALVNGASAMELNEESVLGHLMHSIKYEKLRPVADSMEKHQLVFTLTQTAPAVTEIVIFDGYRLCITEIILKYIQLTILNR